MNGDYSKHLHQSSVIMSKITPVFRDLSAPDLLRKCLHVRAQNPTESVKQKILIRLPKTVFIGRHTLHLGVYDAINSKNKEILKVAWF